jgi:ubiquinone/menaquinone biosynthesis C-methylase UbiE
MKNNMLFDNIIQEQNVSKAFSKQSSTFDETDAGNEILQWMRSRVYEKVLRFWQPGEHILEINSGTGIDALFFAKKGFFVHATDNSPGMLLALGKKVIDNHLENKITFERCSFLELESITDKKFDHIFSNFGGLNCTNNLQSVIDSFFSLLKPCGTVTLVIMPPVCPWEMLYAIKGDFKLAFRRFKKNGAPSHLEGIHFTTWYYTPEDIQKMFGANYEIVSVTGLGIVVPPPFKEDFPKKHPYLYKKLVKIENAIAAKRPFCSWSDHFILTATKIK